MSPAILKCVNRRMLRFHTCRLQAGLLTPASDTDTDIYCTAATCWSRRWRRTC
jgi:hypothetical protein